MHLHCAGSASEAMKQSVLEKTNKEIVGVRPSWSAEIESKDKRAYLNYQLEERDFWFFVR